MGGTPLAVSSRSNVLFSMKIWSQIIVFCQQYKFIRRNLGKANTQTSQVISHVGSCIELCCAVFLVFAFLFVLQIYFEDWGYLGLQVQSLAHLGGTTIPIYCNSNPIGKSEQQQLCALRIRGPSEATYYFFIQCFLHSKKQLLRFSGRVWYPVVNAFLNTDTP